MIFNTKQVASFLLLAVVCASVGFEVPGARRDFFEAERDRDLQLLGGGLSAFLSALSSLFGGGLGIFLPSELDLCLAESDNQSPDFSVVAAGRPGKVDGFAIQPENCGAEAAVVDPKAALEFTAGVGSIGSGSLCLTSVGSNPFSGASFVAPLIPLGQTPAAAFNSGGVKFNVVGLDTDSNQEFRARLFVDVTQFLSPTEPVECSYFIERQLNVANGFELITFDCEDSRAFNNPDSCPPSLEAAKAAPNVVLGSALDGTILSFAGIDADIEDQGLFGGFFSQFFGKKAVKSIGFCIDEVTLDLQGVGLISIDLEVA